MCSIPKQTLWETLSGPKRLRILIPRIQRDYAHGREDKAAKEVRTTLVAELINSLNKQASPNDRAGVDLGLVFGAAHEDVVTLYDGQQRFTTLFLLHWCLAWMSRDCSAADDLQRFSYNSRLHSRDFCRALTTDGLQLEPNGIEPSQRFLDATWFCPIWRTDPTVAGMMVVIDYMYKQLPKGKQEAEELWSRLKSGKAPCFSWLKLKNEDSNEDLYVKLNSRGRNLTEFEKLKAWLEQQENDDNESWKNLSLLQWKHRLDNEWLNLFWRESNSNTETMDGTMLAFFLGNASNLANAGKEGLKNELIQTIHDKGFLSKKEWAEIFTPETLPPILQALSHLEKLEVRSQIDQWAQNSKILHFTSQDTVSPLSTAWLAGWTKVEFRQRLLYFGLLRFLIECPPGSPGWVEPIFSRWMRLVRNLGENSTLGSNNLENAIKSIKSIAPNQMKALDQWVSEQPNGNGLTGLDKDQWQDEIAKAKLRLDQNCEDTRASLDAAEDQPFLRGQIGFLISLATSSAVFNLQRFKSYSATMLKHFSERDGPKKDNRVLLQQALLSIGDYSGGDGRKYLASNQADWRNVFRSERAKYEKHQGDQQAPQSIIKTFLDLGDEVDLNEIVKAKLASLDWLDWRKWVLASKYPLEFCRSSRINCYASGNTAILLEGTDYRAASAELRTYFIFKEILEGKGWLCTRWLKENSHIYRIDDRIRLELHHVTSIGFALRILIKSKDKILPPGFSPPPEALQLREHEIMNDWEYCGLCQLERPYTPETVAEAAQIAWHNLR